jgi:hypothetical protein
VIYVLAAYSITLGVLALYLVLLQHRRRESAEQLARHAGLPISDPRAGFNAGAMLLAPFWLMGHGMLPMGLLLLVPCLVVVPLYQRGLWIPLLFVAIVPAAAAAALGFVGNRIAVKYTGIQQPGAFSASQLPWAIAGITLHVFVLPWVWYALRGVG